MGVVDWSQVWPTVAERLAAHRSAGRSHLLTEDVVRFETVQALDGVGVGAQRLKIEVFADSLVGGRLDLTVDGPSSVVVEFKFPRDSRTGTSPDTMTLGEVLRDFFRVAGVPAEQRWVVLVLSERLHRFLDTACRRYGLQWASEAGQQLRLPATGVAVLPVTATRALGTVERFDLTATCEVVAPVGQGLALFAYLVDGVQLPSGLDARAGGAVDPPVNSATPPPQAAGASRRQGTRDGARREILAAAQAVLTRAGADEFTIAQVIDEMHRRDTGYADSTIRTMLTSHLCADASGEGVAGYSDVTRTGRGTYRLVP